MPPKKNPLNLNALQLKTLTLFQALADVVGEPGSDGGVTIARLPHAHGDHFHLGDAVVSGRDATGLGNPSVWAALERKGLIGGALFPQRLTLTALGREYDTGMADSILHRADH